MSELDRYCPPEEEPANSWSHGIGIALSIVALVAMLWVAIDTMDPWRITGATVHGSALVALFASSTAYHAFPVGPWKNTFQNLDHMLIYAVIAGTWTPYLLVTLKGLLGFILLGVQWGVASFGIALKIHYGPMKWRRLSMALYISMGLLVLPFLWTLSDTLPVNGLIWLVAGGAAYLVGVIFYRWDSLPFNHFLWHLFVLAGAGCHVASVLGYVLPTL